MALASDITLNPGSYGGIAADLVFSDIGPTKDLNGKLRRVAATALTAPETHTINHRVVKEGVVPYDQHMVRLDWEPVDPVLGAVKQSTWIVVRVPRGTSVVTVAKVKDQIGRAVHSFLLAGATDKILAGES